MTYPASRVRSVVGLFAHAIFSNMKDANDSAHIILKATMMPERNLYSKGIHDDDGNKNARKQCLFKEENYSTASKKHFFFATVYNVHV